MILHTNISPRRKTDSPLQLQAYNTGKQGKEEGKNISLIFPFQCLYSTVMFLDLHHCPPVLKSELKSLLPYLAMKVKSVLYQLSFLKVTGTVTIK